jgi:hypothetical protein
MRNAVGDQVACRWTNPVTGSGGDCRPVCANTRALSIFNPRPNCTFSSTFPGLDVSRRSAPQHSGLACVQCLTARTLATGAGRRALPIWCSLHFLSSLHSDNSNPGQATLFAKWWMSKTIGGIRATCKKHILDQGTKLALEAPALLMASASLRLRHYTHTLARSLWQTLVRGCSCNVMQSTTRTNAEENQTEVLPEYPDTLHHCSVGIVDIDK